MKRMIPLLTAALLLMVLTACGGPASSTRPDSAAEAPPAVSGVASQPGEQTPTESQPEEKTDAFTAYASLLERFYSIVSDPEGHMEDIDDAREMGVWNTALYMTDGALEAMGYCILDLSGDGVPELAVGQMPEYGGQICALYTLVDGQPAFVCQGWHRSAYTYAGSGRFSYYGSNGAAESAIGMFALTGDGTALVCQDFFFYSCTGQEDCEACPLYYNSTGSWNPEDSERTELTISDFQNLEPELQNLPMTPFAALDPDADLPEVFVQFAPDAFPYDTLTLSEDTFSCRLLFTAVGPVSNFTLLDLTLEDFGEDGTLEYSACPSVPDLPGDVLAPDRPFVVQLEFVGDLPSCGFSYEDSQGNLRRFAMMLSGMDGSVLLWEADPDDFNLVLRSKS